MTPSPHDPCPVFWSEPDFYVGNDVLLRIATLDDALAYIDGVLANATVADVESIICAFFDWNVATFRTRSIASASRRTAQKGGTNDTNDRRLHAFLECADSCHDFADNNPGHLPIVLSHFPDVELPKGFNTKWFNCRKPFVDFFATREELIFGKAVIPNPLFEANLYTQWDLKRAVAQHPNRSLDDHFKSQQQSYATRLGTYTSTRGKLLPLDVFTLTHQLQTNPKIETLKLLQVAQLCGRMRDVFGLRARFVADRSDDQLVLLLLAADKLTRKFNKRFVIDPPNATLRSISQALKEALANVGVQELFWETCMTDTNVCDATRNPTPLPIDASATGDIYRPDAVVHVHLNGVQAVKSKPFVRVTVKDVDGLQTTFDVTNEQATNHFGKDYLRGMIASTNFPVPLSSSVRKPTLEQHIVSFSHTLKYALKRAGDWGQVAHCARYDKVFVTSDILAAMYAHYRGVRYMLLRRQENLNEEYPTLPTFIRYTFVLHG